MKKESKISIIVPIHNGEKYIDLFMRGILNQSPNIIDYELILVNNNSTDNTQQILLGYPQALTVNEKIKGSYAARNKGISVATGDFFYFTDIDCIPSDSLFSKLSEYTEEMDSSSVYSGKVEFLPSSYTVWGVFDTLTFLNQEHNSNMNIAVTANLLVPRTVFDVIGDFDYRLQSGGDIEWTKRLRISNQELVYKDDLVMYHPIRETFTEASKKSFRVGYGNGQLLRSSHRYYAIIKPSMLIPTIKGINKINNLTPFKEKISFINKIELLLSVSTLQVYNYVGKLFGMLGIFNPKG